MSHRILVVDPDEGDRALLRTALDRVQATAGFSLDVTEARDGTTAMAMLSEKSFQLVLAEAILEGVSGFALLRALAKREQAPPVVLVTRMTRETDRFWGLRNGAVAYITKPFDQAALIDRVARILTDPKTPSERPLRL